MKIHQVLSCYVVPFIIVAAVSVEDITVSIDKNNETGSRSPCMRPRSDPPNFGPIERGEKQTNNTD